jgi:translation elongation factor EF-Tu-like GTPase
MLIVMAYFRPCRAQVVDEKKTFEQDQIHINIGAMSHFDHGKITFTPAMTRNETIKEETS